jgi:hypothetical protein
MRPINKNFQAFRKVFLSLGVFFAVLTPVQAQNQAFTVENVTVDITAESAVAARKQAFEKAQADALQLLAARFMDEQAALAFQAPDPMTISTLIQDFEITAEKISTVRYIGTYKFRFKEQAVTSLFGKSGAVVHTDVSVGPILVLPFYQEAGSSRLWGQDNAWMNAWVRAGDLQAGGSSLLVPLGDLEDVRDVGSATPAQISSPSLSKLFSRYSAAEGIIAEAIPDDVLGRIASDSDAASGSLSVRIYRTDRGKSELVHIVTRSANSSDTLASLMDATVQDVRAYIGRKDWKQGQVASVGSSNSAEASGGGRNFALRVPFASLAQWTEIQRALRQVQGVNGIKVKSLSPQHALVDLKFSGDEQFLRAALSGANMSLSAPPSAGANAIGGIYGSNSVSATPVVYDLNLNRYMPN